MINTIHNNAEESMKKCIESFRNKINKIRTNRASSNLIDDIQIEYYGKFTPLHQIANILVENSRTLTISLFDRSLSKRVEKAIMASNLGLFPCSVGEIIRLSIPPLTEERRKNFIKIVRSEAEKGRISIRNIRRDANDKVKFLLQNKQISEDEERNSQDYIQKLVNLWIHNLDKLLIHKESELMEF